MNGWSQILHIVHTNANFVINENWTMLLVRFALFQPNLYPIYRWHSDSVL